MLMSSSAGETRNVLSRILDRMFSSVVLPLMALSSGLEPTLISLVVEFLPCKIVLKGYVSRLIVSRDEELTTNRPVYQM